MGWGTSGMAAIWTNGGPAGNRTRPGDGARPAAPGADIVWPPAVVTRQAIPANANPAKSTQRAAGMDFPSATMANFADCRDYSNKIVRRSCSGQSNDSAKYRRLIESRE